MRRMNWRVGIIILTLFGVNIALPVSSEEITDDLTNVREISTEGSVHKETIELTVGEAWVSFPLPLVGIPYAKAYHISRDININLSDEENVAAIYILFSVITHLYPPTGAIKTYIGGYGLEVKHGDERFGDTTRLRGMDPQDDLLSTTDPSAPYILSPGEKLTLHYTTTIKARPVTAINPVPCLPAIGYVDLNIYVNPPQPSYSTKKPREFSISNETMVFHCGNASIEYGTPFHPIVEAEARNIVDNVVLSEDVLSLPCVFVADISFKPPLIPSLGIYHIVVYNETGILTADYALVSKNWNIRNTISAGCFIKARKNTTMNLTVEIEAIGLPIFGHDKAEGNIRLNFL